LALIIQGYLTPRFSGHLSNERRIAKGLNSWSIEYINHSSNECHSETFRVSNNQLPLEKGQINCSKKDDVINKLKGLLLIPFTRRTFSF
jgi:hypothetical protein